MRNFTLGALLVALVQLEASSHSLRRTLSSELASDKLTRIKYLLVRLIGGKSRAELAANGAGFPAGRTRAC